MAECESGAWRKPRALRFGPGSAILFLITSLIVALPGRASGQTDRLIPLGTDHWAYPLLDRLGAAGMLGPHGVGGGRPLSVAAVASALRHAADQVDGGGRGDLAALAEHALAQLLEEYPLAGQDSDRRTPARGIGRPSLGIGLLDAAAEEGDWRGAVVDARLVAAPIGNLAILYEPQLRFGVAESGSGRVDTETRRLIASTAWRGVRFYGGREYLDFAVGSGGGIVLSDAVAFDGLGLSVDEPIQVRWLGPVRGSLFLSRIGGDELGGRAYFGAMRFAFSPYPWVQAELNRTILLATEVTGERLGPGEFLQSLVGKHTAFEDQKASIGLRFLAEVAGWPVQPYVELGFEDTAGIDEDPGLVTGIHLPSLPGLPALSFRYEYAAFGGAARPFFGPGQSRNWYRHARVRSRYVDSDGVPLGHPLGGYGYEHRFESGVWLSGSRVQLDVAAFARDREDRNILADLRPGKSVGGSIDVRFRARPGFEIAGQVHGEDGRAGWRERVARIGVSAFF